MSQLPTGTVTFLVTDVEGSTRLLSETADADAYRTLLEDHRRLIREAVERHGGAIFGTEGDAVFAAFDRAVAALAAAADAQRALRDHRWPAKRQVRVRAGVHSGDVALTDGDYVGLTLHEVARISAAAHGGQILVSGTTRELATDAGLPALELRDLGEHQLKDISHPVRLYQLVGDGLLDESPPPRTRESRPNNLPVQLTSFVGRRELDEGKRLLAGTRLLTLTGPGGTGKTRLGLQLAAEASDEAPDGVFFVPLDAVRDPTVVPSAIVGVLAASSLEWTAFRSPLVTDGAPKGGMGSTVSSAQASRDPCSRRQAPSSTNSWIGGACASPVGYGPRALQHPWPRRCRSWRTAGARAVASSSCVWRSEHVAACWRTSARRLDVGHVRCPARPPRQDRGTVAGSDHAR